MYLSLILSGGAETCREAVTDAYHGVEVTEDHRWLEDAAAPEVQACGCTPWPTVRARRAGVGGAASHQSLTA